MSDRSTTRIIKLAIFRKDLTHSMSERMSRKRIDTSTHRSSSALDCRARAQGGPGNKMTSDTFREIEQGYEAKFKLDEELRFRVQSRRNKLFGLWAAEKLGLDDGQANDYARSLIRLDLERPGHADLVDKVLDDFSAGGVGVDERETH